jgi:DnaJ family protein A protein 5
VGKEHFPSPSFGDEDSTFEEVAAFYEHWRYFTTLKQFSYADVYDSRDAPNRRVKRIIEEENRRERQKEKNNFNDLIRN